jgi:long-subunit fatty acid transport protein
MKKIHFWEYLLCFSVFILINYNVFSQNQKSAFLEKVRWGGGAGLSVGNEFTNVNLAPSAIYEANEFVSFGIGIQGSYLKQKRVFESFIYGASLLGLVNPIEFLQFSAEIEQLRVHVNNVSFESEKFWNTAIFLGAGYRSENVTIGIRYNVLHKNQVGLYNDPWMPFVRIYF